MADSVFEHGGDIYDTSILYDFSACVSPLGLPPSAKAAAAEALDRCGNYPDPQCRALKEALSSFHGLPASYFLPGNGAAELIYALCQAIRPARVLVPVPGFLEYRRAALSTGSEVLEIRRGPDTAFSIPTGLAAELPKRKSKAGETVLFLTNPDHPAGTVAARQELFEIASACEEQGIWFCLDESFLPFLREEADLSLLGAAFSHLVVLRAFTKIYAMAGLRLGYLLIKNETLLERVRRALQPWNVSIPAQAAGAAALKDRSYIERVRELTVQERTFLEKELKGEGSGEALAKQVFPGRSNFILFRAEEDLKEKLLRQGILIRSFEKDAGLGPGYFRIGVRSHEENEFLIRRWRSCR